MRVWEFQVAFTSPCRCLSSPRVERGGRGGVKADGDKANYFHLSAALRQQTCNLKRSQ